jgi:hypothetical protein
MLTNLTQIATASVTVPAQAIRQPPTAPPLCRGLTERGA